MQSDSAYSGRIFEFEGQWGVPSHCGLRLIEKENHTFVILTELYETNPGTSVTRWMVQLANQLCDLLRIDREKSTFIVHIPDRKSKMEFYKESFTRVNFDIEEGSFVRPVWQDITKEEMDKLFG